VAADGAPPPHSRREPHAATPVSTAPPYILRAVQPPSPRRRCASTSGFSSFVACAWRAIPDGFWRGPCSPTSGAPASFSFSPSQTAGSRSPPLEMLLPDTPFSFHPCLPAERMDESSLQTGYCVLYFSISRSILSGFSLQCLQ
jgi:hypothetical protein